MALDDLDVIAGFGLTGYRSFWSEEPQLVGPMAKVHLVVGPNNSGKSNVLRFASRILSPKHRVEAIRSWATAGNLEQPIGAAPNETLLVSLGIWPNIETARHLLAREFSVDESYVEAFAYFLGLEAFRRNGSELAWFDFQVDSEGTFALIKSPQFDTATAQYRTHDSESGHNVRMELGSLVSIARNQGGRAFGSTMSASPVVLVGGLQLPALLPQVAFIDALRQVRTGDPETASHSGENLVIRLAELQNPPLQNSELLKKFEDINRFVQTVLEDSTARIHIPYTHDKILISSQGRVLPLEYLGMGVQEVIILAAAATVLEKHLVCIEEPEVHMHPVLQRRLTHYLRTFTDNRYLIATHSAHILDTNVASISQVAIGPEGSSLTPAVTPVELASISSRLGYRASDLVQSNCVIWVEGPSDRLYIRHWIALLDMDILGLHLIEGVHYTIMFYGGSVLSHLSTGDPGEEVDEFISLRRLNRNIAVVIDSDKVSESDPLNETKQRVLDEVGMSSDCFTWVTAGYTIENYIPVTLFEESIKTAYPNASNSWTGEQYKNPLSDLLHTGTPKKFEKTKVSEIVITNWSSQQPWEHDLKERIQELVQFVGRSNHIRL